MKRLVYTISTFLILTGMYGGSVGAKNHDTDDEKIWCATREFSERVSRSTCDSKRGKIFSTESQADAEFDRLNPRLVISTASSSSKVWCSTPRWYKQIKQSACISGGGSIHTYEYQAEAAHKGLKATAEKAEADNLASQQGLLNLQSGLTAYYEGAYSEAYRFLAPLAAQGDPRAQVRVANMLIKARGVQRDEEEAMRLFSMALQPVQLSASDGKAWAQFDLGDYFHDGWVIDKDYRNAVYWYRRSAEQGYAPAQNTLGWLYMHGHGVSPDEELAIKWFRRAAEQGDVTALDNLKVLMEVEKDSVAWKEAEKKRKTEAEKKRKAEQAREQEKQDAYSALRSLAGAIKGKIQGNWSNRLACSGQEVIVSVRVNISGEVTAVKVVGDSGDDACRRSAENAAYKASPLPYPDNPRYFKWLDQEFQIKFAPDDLASSSSTKPSTVSNSTSESSKQKMVWCATEKRYQWISESRCTEISGISHDSPIQAFGTHSRLKTDSVASSSTTVLGTYKVWCVTQNGVFRTSDGYCRYEDGREFASKRQAEAELKRLKAASSTASSSGSKVVWCATANWATNYTERVCKSVGGKSYSSEYLAKAEHNRLKGLSSTDSSSNSNLVWCASAKWFRYTEYSTCRDEDDGKSYLDKAQAKAEHERLKEAVKTAQTTCTPEVDKTYWESVRESKDADMLNAYLKKCPSGDYVELAKIKLSKLGNTGTPDPKPLIPKLNYGRYHALVIGNDRYEQFRDLRTAVNDARTVSNLLKNDYGFDVTLLENATRSEILGSINKLKNKVDRNDNVLIYYAGHGYLDPETDEGFWIPIDADRDDESNWLLTDRVRSKIKAMSAKHVMVVADSCFSGKFTRSAITRGLKIKPRSSEYVPALQRLIDKKSRTALTSGGLEPVLDSSSGGNHSVFAEAFISILSDNEGVLDAASLFSQIRPKVINNSDQTPEYSTIHQGGHDGGDFLFVRRQ